MGAGLIYLFLSLGSNTADAASLTNGLVSYWKFDTGSGTVALDSVGSNNGVLVGGPVFTTGPNGVGGAVSFTSNYAQVPSSASINSLSSAMTVSLWVNNRASYPQYATLVGRRSGAGSKDLWLMYYNPDAGNTYGFGVRTTSPTYMTGPSSAGDLNAWVHLVGVYDGTQMLLYKNGVLVASQALSGTIPSDTSPVVMGAGDEGTGGMDEYVNASLSNVAIWNRALTATDVQTLYAQGLLTTAVVPAAPSNLTATVSAASSAQINLAWTDNSNNETGYKIDRSTNGVAFVNIASAPAGSTSYSDSGLASGVAYSYHVSAFNAAGSSAYAVVASVTTPVSSPLVNGLVAHWKFEEGSGTVVVDSAGANNGVLVGGPVFTTGRNGTGGAVSFTSNYAQAPSSASINSLSSTMTVSLWVNNRASYSQNATLIGRRSGAGSRDLWLMYYNPDAGNTYGFGVRTASPTYLTGPSSAGDLNAWVHLVGVYDGTQMLLYKNGVLVASQALSGTIPSDTSPVVMGAGDEGTGGMDEYVNASLSDVAMWNRALSATEVQTLYTQGVQVSSSVPAAPSSLTAAAASGSEIDLRWADNASNEDGYKIEQATSAAGPFTQIGVVGPGQTTYANTGLSGSTVYYYRVRAFNTAGNSGYSNTGSAATQTIMSVPSAPSGLTAVATSAAQIILGWVDNAAGVETGFKLQRAASAQGPWSQIGTTAAGVSSYLDTGLSGSTAYYYRVCASDPAGDSAYSSVASATTPLPSQLGNGLVAHWKFEEGSGTVIVDSAGANNGALVGGPIFTTGRNGTVGAVSFTGNYAQVPSSASINSLSSTMTVSLWVNNRASYSQNATLIGRRFGSASSDLWLMYYNPDAGNTYGFGLRTTSPTYMTGPSSAGDLNAWVHLVGVYDGTQMLLYKNGVLVASQALSGTIPSDTSPVVMGAGDEGTGGMDEYVNASLSDVAMWNRALSATEVQTLYTQGVQVSSSVPAAPSSLTAAAASGSEIDLRWADNASNEDGYKIEQATSAAGPFTQIGVVGPGQTTYANTGLSGSTVYYYRVRAFNAAGNSGYSNTGSATTQAGASVPAAPSNLAVSSPSATEIDLTWTDNSSNETGFKIQRAVSSSGPWTLVATAGAGAKSYADTGLASSTMYYYRVCATNASGDSAYSNQAVTSTLTAAAPSAPSNLNAAAVSSALITLSWTDNSNNEAGFNVQRATSSSGPWTQIGTTGANVVSFSDGGVLSGTTYYYRVSAYN